MPIIVSEIKISPDEPKELAFEKALSISAPRQEWIVKYPRIDIHHAINVTLRKSRCADDHMCLA